jgi:membrane fusion protein (multidrug efflux system)
MQSREGRPLEDAEPQANVVPVAPPAPKKSNRAPKIAAAVFGCVALAGGLYYRHVRAFEDTDDAQVDGDISAVSPRVTGTIKAIYVSENQPVKAGDLLAELDPADYQIGVLQAKAAVAQAEAQLRAEEPGVAMSETTNSTMLATSGSDISNAHADLTALEHAVGQSKALLEQAKASQKLADLDVERAKKLAASGSISSAELDQRTAQAEVTRAATLAAEQGLSAATDRIAQARARLSQAVSRAGEVKDNGPRQVLTRQAAVEVRRSTLELTRAQLAQAELNLVYTKVTAPVSGIVGKKSISLGDRVQPGQQLMALTQAERLWVTANYRETQLKDMRPSQPATIYVDALERELSGVVESIGGATGARYSLLPPENATGNYVKVVQRVPVRIRLNEGQPGLEMLRPGLSAVPRVRVR